MKRIEMLPPGPLIVIPEFMRDSYDTAKDQQLADEIRASKDGVELPLLILRDEEGDFIIKGTRRKFGAMKIGTPKVPCIVRTLPPGRDRVEFMTKLRMVANKWQDLTPTQRAKLIKWVQDNLGMSKEDIRQELNLRSTDTIGNWLQPLQFIEPVRAALDKGIIKPHAARIFVGLNERGQEYLLEHHVKELAGSEGKGELHKRLRATYPPSKHPEFYVDPEDAQRRLAVKQSRTRKRRQNAPASVDEKKLMLASVEMKDSEMEDNKRDIKRFNARRDAACVLVGASVNDEKRKAYVEKVHGETMVIELEMWAKAHLAD